MPKNLSKPHVAVSKTGDVLIIQGSGCPVLFLPSTQIATLFETPDKAVAVLISEVGAAAIETLLAGNASFESTSIITDLNVIESVTLRFELPNGLKVAYTTDDVGAKRAQFKAQGIDLIVTDTAVDWSRQHASFIGNIISNVPTTPPQIVGLQRLDPRHLATLVREALKRPVTKNRTKDKS